MSSNKNKYYPFPSKEEEREYYSEKYSSFAQTPSEVRREKLLLRVLIGIPTLGMSEVIILVKKKFFDKNLF